MRKTFYIGLAFAVVGLVFGQPGFLTLSKAIIFVLFLYASAKYLWLKFVQVRSFQKQKGVRLGQKKCPPGAKITKAQWHALNEEGTTLSYPWDD